MLNRRKFLLVATAALTSLTVPFSSSVAKQLTKLATKAGGVSGLDAECTVYRDGLTVARLNLVEVITNEYTDPRLDQGVLNFTAVKEVHLPEADYELSHPVLGRFHVFLQTRGTLNVDQHDGLQYQACFCHLRAKYQGQYPPPIA